jgi:hypothetical protein
MPSSLKKFTNTKKALLYRNKQRKINYDLGNFSSNSSLKKWTFDDEKQILTSKESDRTIAKDLSTSVRAIQMKRFKLKRKILKFYMKHFTLLQSEFIKSAADLLNWWQNLTLKQQLESIKSTNGRKIGA